MGCRGEWSYFWGQDTWFRISDLQIMSLADGRCRRGVKHVARWAPIDVEVYFLGWRRGKAD